MFDKLCKKFYKFFSNYWDLLFFMFVLFIVDVAGIGGISLLVSIIFKITIVSALKKVILTTCVVSASIMLIGFTANMYSKGKDIINDEKKNK